MDIRSIGNTPQPAPAPVDKKTSESLPAAKAAAQQLVEAVAEPPPPPPTMAQITQAVNSINQAMQAMSQDLEFSVDQDSHQTIVKVVDQKTKEVLRQIPSVETLAIAKALEEAQQGLLIRQKA